MLLTREAAARFLPFYDAFLHDKAPLNSHNSEQFFNVLFHTREVKYHQAPRHVFPMTTVAWVQPQNKTPMLCRKPSQNCMPESFNGPPLCCVKCTMYDC